MSITSRIFKVFRILTNRKQAEKDLDEEIRFHIENAIHENICKGMDPKEARRIALLEFGGPLKIKEECRASWGVRFFDDLTSDLRFGMRQILKHKVQNLIIITTIAICISSTVLADYFFQNIVGRPYSYGDAQRVYKVGKTQSALGGSDLRLSVLHYEYIRNNCDAFQSVGLLEDGEYVDLQLGHTLERISLDKITPSMWNVVNIKPIWGNFFHDSTASDRSNNIIVLSESLWKKINPEKQLKDSFSVLINEKSYEVIGVAPESFFLGWNRADAWIPKIITPEELQPDQRNNLKNLAFGRLKNDKTPQDASYQLENAYEAFMDDYPDERDERKRLGSTFKASELNRSITLNIPELRTAFLSARLVTFLLLAIGCLNVSGILIVRIFSRMQEFSMRRALGASIFRILRQLYAEVIMIFLIGGLFGVGFLFYGFEFANWIQLDRIPWVGEWKIELGSIGFMCLIATIGSLFSVAFPIFLLLRKNALSKLRNTSRTASGSLSRHRLQSGFVISQIALTFIMLMVSAVLLQNLRHTLSKNIGFEAKNRLIVEIPQPEYRFGSDIDTLAKNTLSFQERILNTLHSIQGVNNVSVSNRIPMSYKYTTYCSFSMSHYQYNEGEAKPFGLGVTVSPGYFETVGTKILRGRDFTDTDNTTSEPVVIISTKTVDKYFQETDPLGKTINIWGRDLKIVGVAETIQDKPFFMESSQHALYFPTTQWRDLSANRSVFADHSVFLIETQRPFKSIRKQIENIILATESNVSMQIYPLTEVVKFASFTQRFPLYMVSIIGLIALMIATLGIYGLVSFSVQERTKEFGIRMALGAVPGKILKKVINQNLRIFAIAILIGMTASALILSQTVSLFPEINPLRLTNFLSVGCFVFVVVLSAAMIPAMRIGKIDVIESLHCE